MKREVDTIVIGGGQAGLSVSYYLKLDGREHIVLEQAEQAAKPGETIAGTRSP